jgi:hypothetical protein
MIKKVVILVEQYFTNRDYERYGIEKIIENDFIVEVWDLSLFLWPKSSEIISFKQNYEHQNIVHRFKKLNIVLLNIRKETTTTFFLSTIIYSYKTFKIFREISILRLKYGCTGAYSTGIFPGLVKSKNSSRIKNVLRIPIKEIFNETINRILSLRLMLKFLRIKPATFFAIIGGEKTSCSGPIISEKTELVKIHSLNYDIFLKTKKKKSRKNIVYIDQYMPFHPDFLYGVNKLDFDVDQYYKDLRNIFEKIEKKSGINVIIAAHPRAFYHDKNHLFGNRQIIHNSDSFDLVENASLILMHVSMAISFPVLLNKPIIFLTSNLLNSNIIGKNIHGISKYFNVIPLNMNMSFDELSFFYADISMYDKFKNDYIKESGTKEILFWQQVSDVIKRY